MSTGPQENANLHAIYNRALQLDVPIRVVPQDEVQIEEPNLKSHLVLESTTTGIIDSHSLMACLEVYVHT